MKRLLLLVCALLCITGVIHAQDAVPVPTLDPNRYQDLPQDVNGLGFPQIGFPSAPVSVVIYGAFDDPASAAFWRDSFSTLVERVRTGEIKLTYVPLNGRGSIPNGLSAARASLCAAEQNGFWQFHDMLFTWQLAYGNDAFAGQRLVDGATSLPINRATWDQCMLSDRPDVALNQADVQLQSINELVSATIPIVTVDDAPSLTDPASLEAAIQYEISQNSATFAAQLSATPVPQTTVDPNSTEPVVVTIQPLLHVSEPPPLIIGLPPGWSYGYDTLVLQDLDAIRNMPIAVYTGSITGGTGTIVLIWGFPNLIPVTGADGNLEPNLWADGLRLLRLAVLEPSCNIGTDLQRDYSVGGLNAVGTQFSAVSCPQLSDTRGWFAGLQQFNLNFVFYAYTDPISGMDGQGAVDLQHILDSVRFVEPPTPTPAPETPTPSS